jgi:hypothetical protein
VGFIERIARKIAHNRAKNSELAMKLAQYMATRKPPLSLRAMASAIGTNYSQVRCWRDGLRTPSLEWAERIRVATSGKVKPVDFLK